MACSTWPPSRWPRPWCTPTTVWWPPCRWWFRPHTTPPSTCRPYGRRRAASPGSSAQGRLLLLAPRRLHGVLHEGDERVAGRLAAAGVAEHDRHARVEVQGELHLGRLV